VDRRRYSHFFIVVKSIHQRPDRLSAVVPGPDPDSRINPAMAPGRRPKMGQTTQKNQITHKNKGKNTMFEPQTILPQHENKRKKSSRLSHHEYHTVAKFFN